MLRIRRVRPERLGKAIKRSMDFQKILSASPVQVLRQTASDWSEDNALRLSAALAYYSIFSIAPLLVIAISISGWVFGREAAQGLLFDQLHGLLGPHGAEGVQTMIKSANQPATSLIAAISGSAALLFGASGVFGQLKDALNTIWEVKAKSGQGVAGFIREHLLSFGMVLVIGFLLLISLFLSAAVAAVGKVAGGAIPEPLIQIGTSLASFSVVVVLFAAIFKVLPDAKVRWSDVWTGALVTGILFEIGKLLLGIYLGRESTASPYGAAGSAIMLLLWVYYASLILFFGAEFTKVYAEFRGRRIGPSANAEPATARQREQEGLGTEKADAASFLDVPSPPRESLATTFHLSPAKTGPEPDFAGSDGQKLALLFAAIAGGFAVGTLARKTPHERTPTEEIAHGSKALAATAAAAALTYVAGMWSRAGYTLDHGLEVVKAKSSSLGA